MNTFHRVSGSVVVDKLMMDFGMSAAGVGSVLALYFYVYAAMQVPSGMLADAYGPRRVLTWGCVVAGAGTIVFGLAPSVPLLYLGRFLLTVGVSVVFVSVLTIQANWFPSHYFGRVSSLLGCIGGAGALIGATPMALLVIYAGWRGAFQVLGVLSFLVAAACWLLVRNRPADVVGRSTSADSNLGSAKTPHTDSVSLALRDRLSSMVGNKYVWPPLLIGMGAYGTLLAFQGAWGIPYLMQVYGMARDSAATVMLLLTIGFMGGMLVLAAVSERYRTRKVPAVAGSFVYVGLWLTVLLWNGGKPPEVALYPISLLLGASCGFTILALACVKEVVPRSIAGMSMGLVNIGPFLMAAVLQVIVGLVLDWQWDGSMADGVRVYGLPAYRAGMATIVAGALLYVAGALTLKETHCRDLEHSSETPGRVDPAAA
ncbi:MFS transporter [Chloroflexota bacterium]